MKIKVWVLCTVVPDEGNPALPTVFADALTAYAYYDKAMRAEWANVAEHAALGPYPGNPDQAQARLRHIFGADWGRWDVSCHEIKISNEVAR